MNQERDAAALVAVSKKSPANVPQGESLQEKTASEKNSARAYMEAPTQVESIKAPRRPRPVPPAATTDAPAKAVLSTRDEYSAVRSVRFVEKSVMTQEAYDRRFGFRGARVSMFRRVYFHYRQMLKWHRKEWCTFVQERLPVLRWTRDYRTNWRGWLKDDVLGGLMVAVMSVPQSLAYAYLVGIEPIHGLYTSIFLPLMYMVFGTSRHTSCGTFAVVAMMSGSAVADTASQILREQSGAIVDSVDPRTHLCCKTQAPEVDKELALELATMLALLVGIWQILLSLLHAGLLAVWLSDNLVQGLTAGAAVHVVTSQFRGMSGISTLPSTTEEFGFIRFSWCFFEQISQVDWRVLTISVVCVFLLLSSAYVVDPVLRRWTNIKFPMELVIVIILTLLVWLSQGTRWRIDVPIVGEVGFGFKMPHAPNFRYAEKLLPQSIVIAIVCFVVHIAMAKLISKDLGYRVDANQEWLALGAMHSFGAFFGCFPGGTSLGRSMMNVKFGTHTQLSSLACALVIVGMCFGMARFIFYLPRAVLAAVVACALKDLLLASVRARHLIHKSVVDFLIFYITFLVTVTVSVNTGLITGVSFALLTVVFRSQWADGLAMGRMPGSTDFKPLGQYDRSEGIKGMRVIRYDAPLYFANSELFVDSVYRIAGINPQELSEAQKLQLRPDKQTTPGKAEKSTAEVGGTPQTQTTDGQDALENEFFTHIIIDCSTIPYVDMMGAAALRTVYLEFTKVSIKVYFAGVKGDVRQFLAAANFHETVPIDCFFVRIGDAVTQAQRDQQEEAASVL